MTHTTASTPRSARSCPICGTPADPARRPFCSKRCADVDLNRWLTGSYRVPTEEPADPGGDPARDDREEP
jgi:hypothetical protein